MPPNYSSDVFRRYLLRALPEGERLLEDNRRESVATTIWLVGLASAALVLAVTHPSQLNFLSRNGQVALVCALSVCVVAGVTHRMLLLTASTFEVGVRTEMRAFLNGMEPLDSVPVPREKSWSDSTIVRALKDDFDLDYSFMSTEAADSEVLRRAYDEVYARWERMDRDLLTSMVDSIAEFSGQDRVAARAQFGLAHTAPVPQQAGRKKTHVTASYWAEKALMLSGAAFAVASVIVALGFAVA